MGENETLITTVIDLRALDGLGLCEGLVVPWRAGRRRGCSGVRGRLVEVVVGWVGQVQLYQLAHAAVMVFQESARPLPGAVRKDVSRVCRSMPGAWAAASA